MRQHRWPPRRVGLLVAGAVTALGLAGCGSSSPNAATITAYDMGYRVSGSLRPGVASIAFRNTGHATHMMAAIRLKPGVTLDQVRQVFQSSGEDAVEALADDSPDRSPTGLPALLSPGQSTTTVTADLKAGSYLLACFVPDDKGAPHAADGMLGIMTVKGSPSGTRPHAKGTIGITDHGFTMPSGFQGSGTYMVENQGTSPHSITMARLEPGTTALGYSQYVNGAFEANKPIEGGGGTLVAGLDELRPGQRAYLVLHLPKGHYGYVSTGGGENGAPTDVAQGLSGEFDVR